ncbi:MFS transporter [Herbiconiux sp. CPCC 205763]|uniref:MFS transporter n=1 Tax=Herbiconiux aconitum TaxID=2970913 RepID=A0ABT2GND2_9MICO|nr:MFS transporter [Herbiconiux aconitum]MCS5717742.1 MFS transporter [Herbiconiux aconitum]
MVTKDVASSGISSRPAGEKRAIVERGSLGHRRMLPMAAAFVGISVALVAVLTAAGAPTPLLPIYQQEWALPPGLLTLTFGIYALSLLVSLLVVGSLSDHVGRRPLMIGALALELAAMLILLVAPSIGVLIVARVIQGIATGAASSALSAAIVELAPERYKRIGGLMSGLAPLAGLGLGALFAGLVGHAVGNAPAVVWAVLAIVMALALVIAFFTPETAPRKAGALRSLVPRVSLPRNVRGLFASTVPGTIGAFMTMALYLGVTPVLLVSVFEVSTPLVGALIAFVAFWAGALVTVLSGRMKPRSLRLLGATSLLASALLFIGSVDGHLLGLLWIAALLGGAGIGAGFSGTARGLIPEVQPHQRAAVFSAIYLVAYLTMGISSIAAGLIVGVVGAVPMATGFGLVLVAASLTGIIVTVARASGRKGLRTHRTAATMPQSSDIGGPPRSRLVLPAILLAVLVMPISISGTGIALPAIAADLGTNSVGLQWVVNGFNASFAIFTLVWGIASDRIGYRTTFALGTVLTASASIISAIAPNLLVLDIGRVIGGVGGAAVFTGATALLSNVFEGKARGRAFALLGTTVGLGVALGPTIAGALVGLVGWSGIYVTFGIISALALVGSAAIPALPSARSGHTKLFDLALLRNKRFLSYALVPVAAGIGFVTLASYLPVALSAVGGLNASQSGLFMLWMTAPVLVTPLLGAKLAASLRGFSSMSIIYISLIALVLGDIGLVLLSPDLPLSLMAIPMLLLGVGFGLPLGLIDSEALASVPSHSTGTAAGIVNFLRLGTEAVFVGAYAAVVSALILVQVGNPAVAEHTAAGQSGNATAYAESVHWVGFGLAALVVAIGVAIAALHSASRKQSGLTQAEEDAQAHDVDQLAQELKIDPLA